jgi:hypothetical protein
LFPDLAPSLTVIFLAFWAKSLPMKHAKRSTAARSQAALRPLNNRSRITNGRDLLPTVDGRCLWARRFRDLLSLHLFDLGGEGNCSEGEKALARRAACLIVELELLEDLFAAGDTTPKRLELYQRLTNTLRRLLESLGLKRRARDVTPSLGDYLRAKQAEDATIEVEA